MIFYIVALVSCVWCWRREWAMTEASALWPRFWLFTALLIGGLALARFFSLSEVVADVGRQEARADGWYASRRLFQAIVVGGLAAAWALSTTVALWRFPARRRRYLPATVIVTFIVCFSAVRVVSLHHIDQVLYNVDFLRVRPVFWVEMVAFTALAITAVYAGRTIASHIAHWTGAPTAEQAP